MLMRIQIKVLPNSKTRGVEEKNGVFIVKVLSPPEKGKANKEAIELLEDYFGKKVIIISGHGSRKKIVEIHD